MNFSSLRLKISSAPYLPCVPLSTKRKYAWRLFRTANLDLFADSNPGDSNVSWDHRANCHNFVARLQTLASWCCGKAHPGCALAAHDSVRQCPMARYRCSPRVRFAVGLPKGARRQLASLRLIKFATNRSICFCFCFCNSTNTANPKP